MNIFYLDTNPKRAAMYHHDKHVVKMILETAQMMAAILRGQLSRTEADALGVYKSTHYNHPCTVWMREGYANYMWAKRLLISLNEEYKMRFSHMVDHKSYTAVCSWPDPVLPMYGKLSLPALAMPDEYKVKDDPVLSYRQYYIGAKIIGARWTRRDVPHWITEGLKYA